MNESKIEVGEEHFALLEAVSRAAAALGIPWLLTGAGGRVLLLEKLMALPAGRATQDYDFAVMVGSWGEYEALKSLICENGHFHRDPRQSQRLWYGEDAKLDLVPFGPIAELGQTVHWPSGDGVVMNVLGFQEAQDAAIRVMVNGGVRVPVAIPPAMLMLKFIAWEDRHSTVPGKDASDIAYIPHHGERIIGQDAFYEEHAEVTESVGWDLELAAAKVLGFQMGRLARAQTRSHLEDFLTRELSEGEDSLLVREVAAGFPAGRRDASGAQRLLTLVADALAPSPR